MEENTIEAFRMVGHYKQAGSAFSHQKDFAFERLSR
jgi:hypothetical protein